MKLYSLKISRINNAGYNKIQRLIWIIPVASVYLSNIMRVVVVCWFLFSTRLTETQHNGRSTQLLPLSQSVQGYWIQYFWTLYCFFTHLWFCCLVKGSSCFAPLRFSLHISLFWLRGDWVFVTFPADLHWLQFQRVQLQSGLCWSLSSTHSHQGFRLQTLPGEGLKDSTRHTQVSPRVVCCMGYICGVLFACVCVHFIFSNLCNSIINFPFW